MHKGKRKEVKPPRIVYGYVGDQGSQKDLVTQGSWLVANRTKEEIGPGYYDVRYTQVSPRSVSAKISVAVVTTIKN